MGVRQVLFLDAARLTAYRCLRGAVALECEFSADGHGVQAFGDYLAKHRGDLFYLLAEVAEEGYQAEDIPPVGGRNRVAIIKRKLAQHFYGTPLAVALAQGRLKTGRRDERMLFAALTRPQHFEPWTEALKQAEAALAGIFSLPQLAAELLAATGRTDPRVLLMTLSRGGLRQTFLDDARLRFSRLTPLPGGALADATAAATACASEAAKIRQYLTGHRLLAADARLTVLILAHPADEALFRAHCRDSSELRFETLDIVAAARRCGLAGAPPDSRCERLFAHLLLRHTPRRQFARSDALRIFRLRQVRYALGAAGLALAAAGLLFAATQLLDLRRLQESTAAMQAQSAADGRKYQEALKALPPLPLPTERLRAVVDRYERLLAASSGPEPLYRRLAAALDDFPAIELERLNWSADAAGTHASDDIAAAAELHGVLPPALADDRRGQVELIDALAARLRADPALDVRILSRPFDAASNAAIRSSAAAAETPKFVLRIAHKP